MKQQKSRIVSKTMKQSNLRRQYLFSLGVFVLLSTLFIMESAFAISQKKAEAFASNLGYSKQVQGAYYAQAKISYNEQDYVYSSRLLNISAAHGHNKSQNLLASQYDMGLGVDVDKTRAFLLYKEAASAGIGAAQHNLAISYAKGHGTAIDLQKAIYWWENAAKRGNTDSQYNLGIVYASGHGMIEKDISKAVKWWRMAAINGDAVAQFNLGTLYANGIGMSNRACEASRWWKKSAANGFAQAKVALAILQANNEYDICR